MRIEKMFTRDIFRSINGVVKADQLDASSIWQELDEWRAPILWSNRSERIFGWLLVLPGWFAIAGT